MIKDETTTLKSEVVVFILIIWYCLVGEKVKMSKSTKLFKGVLDAYIMKIIKTNCEKHK